MIEFFLFFRKLTLRKIFNFFLNVFFTFLSFLFKRQFAYSMPWSYSIEPTNICNLKCRECASGLGLLKRRRGNMSIEDFKIAADNISPYALNCFLYFQGEPFLNKFFFDMVAYANERKIFLATSTNGHFIDYQTAEKTVKSGLDKIIVSLDGFDQESYSAYRTNGDFNKVISAVKFLSKAKKNLKKQNPIIEVQTIVNKINEKKLQEIKKLAFQAGADRFCLKTMQIEKKEDFSKFKTSIEKYSRYDKNNQLKNHVKFCKRVLNSAVIDIDLNVLPCCYDKDSEFKLGNLKTDNLRLVLKSMTAVKCRKKLLFQQIGCPQMCQNCGG